MKSEDISKITKGFLDSKKKDYKTETEVDMTIDNEDDKLNFALKIRMHRPLYKLMWTHSAKNHKYMSEYVRDVLVAHFEAQGIEVPKRMSRFERWIKEVEEHEMNDSA